MRWTASSTFDCSSKISNFETKQKAARLLAGHVQSGQVIGIGSGSTAYLVIQEIAKRMEKDRLVFLGIPTSFEVHLACVRAGIPCTSLLEHRPDWAFDGADEIDRAGNIIKGRGGALYSDKLIGEAGTK